MKLNVLITFFLERNKATWNQFVELIFLLNLVIFRSAAFAARTSIPIKNLERYSPINQRSFI